MKRQIDWEELSKVVLAVGFIVFFGTLLALVAGYYAIVMVFETLFGRW